MKAIYLILLIFFSSVASSQSRVENLGIELSQYLRSIEKDQMVPLLVESSEELSEAIQNFGGRIRMRSADFYSIELPSSKVEAFVKENLIEKLEFSTAPGKTLNDSMRINNNIDSLQFFSRRFPSSHTGKGVIMGIIDSGIDFSHPDFKDSTGNTRILYIWDQTVATNPSRAPQPYNYGVEWDSTDINSGICTHEDPPTNFGHGTMVAGAAAGNALATGKYKGAAPASDLIVVASDFDRVNWLQSVAEAVDYIFKKADQLGRACVINISAGTYAGSHDGQDIAAQIIDQLIKNKNGRAVVAAAGNAGQSQFHLGYDVSQDTNFTWFDYENSLFGTGAIFFKLYADTADFNHVSFGFGADQVQSAYDLRGHTAFRRIQANLNQLYLDTIRNAQAVQLATIKTYAQENNGVYSMEVAIFPDSTQYNYRFSTTGTGRFDIWSSFDLMGSSDIVGSNLPSISQYPAMAFYKSPDSLKSMVSSFTCLPSVLTVANYTNRSSYPSINGITNMGVTAGEISPNSSLGPTRNGGLKPDIAAPGDIMISPGKLSLIQQLISSEPSKISADSMHMRNGGTSMAAPGVAGILALYLEKCPTASYLEMKNALINNARKDSFSPSNFSFKWGYGKADAFRTLKSSNFFPTISSKGISFCDGDTAILLVNQAYSSYQWSNGDSSQHANIFSTGNYFLIAKNQWGCRAISDTLMVSFLPSPTKPILNVQNDTIYSSYSGFHNWYHNGILISGETDDFLKWNSFGDYFTIAIDTTNLCSTRSDTITIQLTAIDQNKNELFKIYPNPVLCDLNIESGFDGAYRISIHNMQAQLIYQKDVSSSMQPYKLDLCHIKAGNYLISIEAKNFKVSKNIIIQ